MLSLPLVALSVTGTGIDHEIRRVLRTAGYAPCYLDSTIAHIEMNGTATDAPGIEPADVETLNALLMLHTGHVESDPEDWAAVWDEVVWTADAFEPSTQDREWAASTDAEALDDLTPAEAVDVESVYDRALHLADELMLSPGDADAFAEQQAGYRRDDLLAARRAV